MKPYLYNKSANGDCFLRIITSPSNTLKGKRMSWPIFLRIPCISKPSVGKNEFKGTLIDFTKIKALKDKDKIFYANKFPKLFSACNNEDTDMIECLMNLSTLTKM